VDERFFFSKERGDARNLFSGLSPSSNCSARKPLEIPEDRLFFPFPVFHWPVHDRGDGTRLLFPSFFLFLSRRGHKEKRSSTLSTSGYVCTTSPESRQVRSPPPSWHDKPQKMRFGLFPLPKNLFRSHSGGSEAAGPFSPPFSGASAGKSQGLRPGLRRVVPSCPRRRSQFPSSPFFPLFAAHMGEPPRCRPSFTELLSRSFNHAFPFFFSRHARGVGKVPAFHLSFSPPFFTLASLKIRGHGSFP